MKPKKTFTVVIEQDEDGLFVGWVPSLPGCHTQAKTQDALMKRIREAIQLCLDANGEDARPSYELIGVQQVTL